MSKILFSTNLTSHQAISIVAMTAVGLVLGACDGGFKRTMGLTKTSPDEFSVVSRAPLSLPPEFSLPTPAPGQTSLPQRNAANQTREAVFGDGSAGGQFQSTAATGNQTQGEAVLLNQANANGADPNIRRILNRETSEFSEAEDSFLNKLLDIGPNGNEVLVDPAGEAERLRENQALGRSVTTGETPEIEDNGSDNFVMGLLNRVMGR